MLELKGVLRTSASSLRKKIFLADGWWRVSENLKIFFLKYIFNFTLCSARQIRCPHWPEHTLLGAELKTATTRTTANNLLMVCWGHSVVDWARSRAITPQLFLRHLKNNNVIEKFWPDASFFWTPWLFCPPHKAQPSTSRFAEKTNFHFLPNLGDLSLGWPSPHYLDCSVEKPFTTVWQIHPGYLTVSHVSRAAH